MPSYALTACRLRKGEIQRDSNVRFNLVYGVMAEQNPNRVYVFVFGVNPTVYWLLPSVVFVSLVQHIST